MFSINHTFLNQVNNLLDAREKITPADKMGRKEIDVRIQATINKTLSDFKSYMASHQVTETDFTALKSFKTELDKINEIITVVSLPKLNSLLNKIQEGGFGKAYFHTHASLQEKVFIAMNQFQDFFVWKIKKKINQEVFYSWNQKLRFHSSLDKILSLNEKIQKLETELTQSPQNAKLETKLKSLKSELHRTELFVKEYEKNLESARQTRHLYKAVGGTAVTLETKDNEKLDGTFLDAQVFRDKCTKCGAQAVALRVPVQGVMEEMSGLIIPRGNEADAFIEILEHMKLFRDYSENSQNKGSGWARINIDGQVAILPDFEVKRLLDNELLIKNDEGYSLTNIISDQVTLVKSQLKSPKEAGTIVLDMGAAGVYEMYKREAIALMMQGMNVMLFNHRGIGESSGTPTVKGNYEDLESVYQYLKQVQHVPDEKIVFRGLCLSGGTVAQLASRHPKVNLILDQTYAELCDIALNTVLDSVKDLIDFKENEESLVKNMILSFLTPILRGVTKMFSPNLNTIKHLTQIEGKILVLRATEDTYTGKQMTDKLLDAFAKSRTPQKIASQVRVGHMAGIHGSTWLDARTPFGENEVALGRYHLFSFLKESKMLNPYIDQGQSLKMLTQDYENYEIHLQNCFKSCLIELPESIEAVPEEFMNIPLEMAQKEIAAGTVEARPLKDIVEGSDFFNQVLAELDRLAPMLGGSPNFDDIAPTINDAENRKTFLGIPLPAVRDWFRAHLKNLGQRLVWKGAARLFNVSSKTPYTQYEEAHIRIQRFGKLIANKERIFDILDANKAESYIDFGLITGMAWHPDKNSPGVEKAYIDFVELFLTDYFEAAKKKGDQGLLEYFSAFKGVCFEDRARELEQYVSQHHSQSASASAILPANILDIDTYKPCSAAFDVVMNDLGARLAGQEVTAQLLLDELIKNEIFNMEFLHEGQRAKPTLNDFQDYVFKMIQTYVMPPYTVEEFLQFELRILEKSGKDLNEANFREQLALRNVSDEVEDFNRDSVNAFVAKFISKV